MLTKEGSRKRIERFRAAVEGDWEAAVISRPEHLLYLGNFYPLPNSLNLHGTGFLVIERDGPVTLFTDNWLAGDAVEEPPHATTSADAVVAVTWYDMKDPGRPRAAVVARRVREYLEERRIDHVAAEPAHLPHDVVAAAARITDCEPVLLRLRERKDPDELDAIRRGIRTAEAVHAASRELLEPGKTELEYYGELVSRAIQAAGSPFVMMCDLASGERAARGGGPPTERRIHEGELVILDVFPYVKGYRGDITNTLVAGGRPSAEQRELFERVRGALERAEALLKPGTPANAFSEAIDEHFRSTGGARLVHHAGHAIGLGHPESPELVSGNTRLLEAGMVVTLEPGLYGRPSGGIRLEHDYLITDQGFERLSQHALGLE